MEVEIRPVKDTEMEEYRRVVNTALMLAPEVVPPEAIHAIRPEITLCAFADGKLATAYAWWPLKMYLNGSIVPIAGITFVGTLPVYRRNGYLRQVIQKHFAMLYEKKWQPLAVLYASQAAIYQRYGYAVVSTRNTYKVEPRHLLFGPQNKPLDRPGRVRELSDSEPDLLAELYQTFCKDRTGYLHRTPAWWVAGPLRPPAKNNALCKVVYEEDAKPLGYALYTIETSKVPYGQPWQRIGLRDLVWLTPTAYRALWQHLAGMDLAIDVTCPSICADDPLPHLLLEPRKLNVTSSDGLLARVVDVARTMMARSYNEDGRITFELIDDLCPWNAGAWQLACSAGKGELARTTQRVQAVVPVDTLAMLLFGQISATQAAAMGRMQFNEEKSAPEWDRLLRTRHKPFCPDFF